MSDDPAAPIALTRVDYARLNARQKETYNFHRTAARLAEFGYNSMLLSDDWLGADFIAYHNDGERFYRIQLKGRLTIDSKYEGKGLYIAFFDAGRLYVYPHDEIVRRIIGSGKRRVKDSGSWTKAGAYSWPSVPSWARELLAEYEVG